MGEYVTHLIEAAEIDRRLTELAAEITRDYAGKTITAVCAQKGAVILLADLTRKMEKHDIEFDFIDVSSYGDATESQGKVVLGNDMKMDAEGRHILIIEDIVDTGHTLVFLREHIAKKNPASLKVCVLLDKPERRQAQGKLYDYAGFTIPDKFVVGYGLDYAQRYRHLPYIGVLNFE